MPRARPSSQDATIEDPTLLRRACEGDRSAFDQLARPHVGPIHQLLRRLVGNHEDAEDLTQECFVRAWQSLRWFRGEGKLGAWLRRIAVHLASDHFRQRPRTPRAWTDTASGDLEAAAPRSRVSGPGEELRRRELDARMDEALRVLPDRLRAALVLRVFEGLDYEEVSRITGVAPDTARRQVMQARRRLLRALAPWTGGHAR